MADGDVIATVVESGEFCRVRVWISGTSFSACSASYTKEAAERFAERLRTPPSPSAVTLREVADEIGAFTDTCDLPPSQPRLRKWRNALLRALATTTESNDD